METPGRKEEPAKSVTPRNCIQCARLHPFVTEQRIVKHQVGWVSKFATLLALSDNKRVVTDEDANG